jgi:hypothetical protein
VGYLVDGEDPAAIRDQPARRVAVVVVGQRVALSTGSRATKLKRGDPASSRL